MTMTHLETRTTAPTHSRKSQQVYRSPSSLDDPSPYSFKKEELSMDLDAEDKEAGTILMALAQHANRLLNEKKASTNSSMSIRNLLDNEQVVSSNQPISNSYTTNKKGFQIPLAQRKPSVDKIARPFKHPSRICIPSHVTKSPHKPKSGMHIHISYRIHAHQTSRSIKSKSPISSSSYPSAFHPAYDTSRRWSQNSSLPSC